MPSEKKDKNRTRVYFIIPAPAGISPGQRFRFEHYLPFLGGAGIEYRLSPFYSLNGWNRLYRQGGLFRKALSVINGFFRRWADLFRVISYHYVYVYREAAPVGPPVFEWIIAKLLRKKIIYDFDDAIWIPVTSEQNKITRYFKWFSKVGTICRIADKVTVGNEFLGDFARKYNKQVIVIPTVVDTDNAHNRLQNQDTTQPVVGWTGTFSTLKYLSIAVPALQRLQERMNFTFLVIANKDPELPLKNYRFIAWDKENEIEDLLKMHIGLMPLYNNDIEKGKCGFKAIQYMALGIPPVVSPVGVNAEIVRHSINGYVAESESDWENYIERLLKEKELRIAFGKADRVEIENLYSVKATAARFISLFE